MKFTIVEKELSDIEMMNKTSRPDDYTSVTTKFILNTFKPEQGLTFLDYGAGKKATQTKKLIEAGYDVTAYDMGNNVTELHDKNALKKEYDVVFASNVLNVQPTMGLIRQMLVEMNLSAKKYIVMNYPSSPRKFRDHFINNKEMKEIIEDILGVTFKVYPNTIFVCKK
jgi:hypothetical protein